MIQKFFMCLLEPWTPSQRLHLTYLAFPSVWKSTSSQRTHEKIDRSMGWPDTADTGGAVQKTHLGPPSFPKEMSLQPLE